MKLKHLIYGISTLVPGVNQIRPKGTGGSDSARYCYSVWLRHLVMAKQNGLDPYPKVVTELGPGDSLGIGLAALISGSERYFAFDVVEHANRERNLKIFDELVLLFKKREKIPGKDEFPKVKPYIENYEFPHEILDEKRLNLALDETRLMKIRDSILATGNDNKIIQYKVPWNDSSILEKESIDMIFSQAVLEHVDDLKNTYKYMKSWLKVGGYISHQIDFKCHGTADEWNGHWTYSETMWKLIKGRRPYLLNREPHSRHLSTLDEEGYHVVCDKRIETTSKVSFQDLAPRFSFLNQEDLTISGAFIQAKKPKTDHSARAMDTTTAALNA